MQTESFSTQRLCSKCKSSPWALELSIREHRHPEGCRSSSLIWPPDGLSGLLCFAALLLMLGVLCMLWSPPSSIITIPPLPPLTLPEPPVASTSIT